ncbi:hypothetical protein LUZ60_010099 [Juncus effusus]|nr:hypothetical protein LUZ60_010099 [Juncus effusus]
MGLITSRYYLWFKLNSSSSSSSPSSKKREREEEKGEMITYVRRSKRLNKDLVDENESERQIITYVRRRKRVSTEAVKENEEEISRKRGREEGAGDGDQIRAVKKDRVIAPCSSPHVSFLNPHSDFSWYDVDLWTEVAKHLDGQDLTALSLVNKWFDRLISEECIWKYACLRDMDVPPPRHVSFPWKLIYSAAFDGSHAYCYRQQDKHIDWMRIGSFFLDSPFVLLTETLAPSKRFNRPGTDVQRSIELTGSCSLNNAKTGIWIADLQLVRCPVCNLNTCEGTMQVLDARHAELFLEENYQNGTWEYEDLGQHRITSPASAAVGAIFDLKYLSSPSTSQILDAKSWVGASIDLQPRAKIGNHAVAVNTNLQPNDGLYVRYQVMRDNKVDGKVVSIRISQQLI